MDNAVKNRFNSAILRRIRQQKVTDKEEDNPPQVLESPEVFLYLILNFLPPFLRTHWIPTMMILLS